MGISNIKSNAYRNIQQMNKSMREIEKSNERLSSGKKLVTDHPSDILKISRLEADVRGSQVAQNNIQDGIAVIDIAQHTLSAVEELGLGLKELAVQYNNDSLSKQDKKGIEKEAQSIIKEMNHLLKETKFNGEALFVGNNGKGGRKITLQTGSKSTDTFTIVFPAFSEDMDISQMLQEILAEIKNGEKNKLEPTESESKIEEPPSESSESTPSVPIQSPGQTDEQDTPLDPLSNAVVIIDGQETPVDDTEEAPKEEESQNTPIQGAVNEQVLEIIHTLPNLSKAPIEDVLNPDFIEEKVLKPLSHARHLLGISQSLLEKRLEWEEVRSVFGQQQLERLKSPDTAKEIMEQVRLTMLLQFNTNLMHQNLDQRRSLVLGLLQ